MKDISMLKEQIRREQELLDSVIEDTYPGCLNCQKILEMSMKLDILISTYMNMVEAKKVEHSTTA